MRGMDLYFLFKGQRDYVHGTDMYEKIADFVRQSSSGLASGEFRMTIHSIVRHQCRLVYSDVGDSGSKPNNAKAEFSFISGNFKIMGWLVETASPVTERYPYVEEKIIEDCSFRENGIITRKTEGYSAIEVVVAMNKHLNVQLFPEAHGKWFFTRIDLKTLLDRQCGETYSVELAGVLGNRMTRSAILINGKAIGYIYFSLVRQ